MSTKYLFLITFLTVIVSRAFLWIFRDAAWFAPIVTDSWHHAYTGVILVIISLLLKKQPKIRFFVLGIGLGLAIDEIVFLLDFVGIHITY